MDDAHVTELINPGGATGFESSPGYVSDFLAKNGAHNCGSQTVSHHRSSNV
jgi:hypothetical protein